MNNNHFNKFKQHINSSLFKPYSKGNNANVSVKEGSYYFRFNYNVLSTNSVCFRIEEFKQHAKYLSGGKRSTLKDNDLTIIYDNIYQIEVKNFHGKMPSGISKQFDGGKFWLNHILSFSAPAKSSFKVYNILVYSKRGSLSRTDFKSQNKQNQKTNIRNMQNNYEIKNYSMPNNNFGYLKVMVFNRNKIINLDNIFKSAKNLYPNGNYTLNF